MRAALPAALAWTLAAPVEAEQRLACAGETLCRAEGCALPPMGERFELHLTDQGAALVDPGRPLHPIPPMPGPGPEGMRLFAVVDGDSQTLLSLRDDGVLTLSVHAGRRAGPVENASLLLLARCEAPR